MGKSIKNKIMTLSISSVLILGILVVIITLTTVKSALMDQVQDSLKGTAAATKAAYDQNSGGYIQATNGSIWKGGFNVSGSATMLATIKEQSGTDVTFYYGTSGIVTSMKDSKDEYMLGEVTEALYKKCSENDGYFSRGIIIGDRTLYGYFLPIYVNTYSNEAVGMIFSGIDKAEADAAINRLIIIIIGIVVAVAAICSVLSVLVSNSIVNSLKKSVVQIQSVAKGSLREDVDNEFLKRKDEVGDLTRAQQILQKELRNIIIDISDNVGKIRSSAQELGFTSQNATAAVDEVSKSMMSISESAEKQSVQTKNTSYTVEDMGRKIESTAAAVEKLNSNASKMEGSSKQVTETMDRLIEENALVRESVKAVEEQTNKTNESAQKIKSAADMIASIAEETSLLALNASIEAARAGESGRGFAVVASQIQHLSEQSNKSSNEISEIIRQLIEDSDNTVKAMAQVHASINTQDENMNLTGKNVNVVVNEVIQSMENINTIRNLSRELDNSRSSILDLVESLSKSAQNNEAIIMDTNASTQELCASMEQVSANAEKLLAIAELLSKSMEYFSVE